MSNVVGTPNWGPTAIIGDLTDIQDDSIVNSDINSAATIKKRTITLQVDGGGFVLTTGIKGSGLPIPFACTINSWKVIGDVSGSIVWDIWVANYSTSSVPSVANTITASAKPTVSGAFAATSSTLTGWTTSITAGQTMMFNVDSVSTMTKATIQLVVTLT